jgi:hypothetical protein
MRQFILSLGLTTFVLCAAGRASEPGVRYSSYSKPAGPLTRASAARSLRRAFPFSGGFFATPAGHLLSSGIAAASFLLRPARMCAIFYSASPPSLCLACLIPVGLSFSGSRP